MRAAGQPRDLRRSGSGAGVRPRLDLELLGARPSVVDRWLVAGIIFAATLLVLQAVIL